jgi:hypothetical protein
MKPGAEYKPDKTSSQTPSHTAPNIPCRRCRGQPTNRVPRCSRSLPTSVRRPVMPTNHETAPRSDDSLKQPGCVLVMQKAMTGPPNAGYIWEQHCEKDLVKLGWTVLESDPSAYYIDNGPHWDRSLRNTDDLSLLAISQQYLDKVRKRLERTWNVTRQPLLPGTSVKYLGMKITRDTNCDITISNPALITNLLAANGLNYCNPSPTPHIAGQDTSKTTDADILTDKIAFQSSLGSCRFLADTKHPQIDFFIGSLGRHAHNTSNRRCRPQARTPLPQGLARWMPTIPTRQRTDGPGGLQRSRLGTVH